MNAEELRAELDAARTKLAELAEEETSLKDEAMRLSARLQTVEARRRELRHPWARGQGTIPDAASCVRHAEQRLADADRVHLRFFGDDDLWVVVSAGPKQVKVRRFGSRTGRVDTVDRATAMRWSDQVVGGVEALDAAVADYKRGAR